MDGDVNYGLTLDECNFIAKANEAGQFIGRVQQFPKLRTRPQKSSIDAIDAIIDMTRDKLRNLDAAAAGDGPAPRTVRYGP